MKSEGSVMPAISRNFLTLFVAFATGSYIPSRLGKLSLRVYGVFGIIDLISGCMSIFIPTDSSKRKNKKRKNRQILNNIKNIFKIKI